MNSVAVMSPWVETEGTFYPLLQDIYPCAMVDITGTPADEFIPDVNLVLLQIEVDGAGFDIISNDNRFWVVWDEPNPRLPDQAASVAERALLLAWMVKNKADGNEMAQLLILGETRKVWANNLKGYLHDRKKAKVKLNVPSVRIFGAEIPMYTTATGKAIYNLFIGDK